MPPSGRFRAAQVCHSYEWRNPLGRAGEGTRPNEMGESSGFAVGADDLGGPLRGLCDSRAHPYPPRMRSALSPYKGEGLRAAARAAPTVGNGPGVLVRQTQAQAWNRTSGNFCKPRAQWPGLNSEKPLHFCAPEIFCPPQEVTPAFWVRGKATMSTKCSSGAVPGGVLVTLPPRAK